MSKAGKPIPACDIKTSADSQMAAIRVAFHWTDRHPYDQHRSLKLAISELSASQRKHSRSESDSVPICIWGGFSVGIELNAQSPIHNDHNGTISDDYLFQTCTEIWEPSRARSAIIYLSEDLIAAVFMYTNLLREMFCVFFFFYFCHLVLGWQASLICGPALCGVATYWITIIFEFGRFIEIPVLRI